MSTNILIDRASGIPLVGSIAFGILDRGSSLIQVRPSTACNMKCTFCSTSANDFSLHPVNYVVEPDYLLEWTKEIAAFKGKLHVNIDSAGEPSAYPHLEYFIENVKKLPEVYFISMQSNGTLLTEKKIKALEKAGLNRINLSLHTLDAAKGKRLFGSEHYNLDNALKAIEILKKTSVEVLLAPVWLPNVNDNDIVELIKFAKEEGLGIAIQKYEVYKHSRRDPEAKKVNFYRFYKQLKEWEREFDMRLVYHADDLQVQPAPRLPEVMHAREKVQAVVKAPGWMPNQMICSAKNRSITVINCCAKIGDKLNIRILESNNNIYLAEVD